MVHLTSFYREKMLSIINNNKIKINKNEYNLLLLMQLYYIKLNQYF